MSELEIEGERELRRKSFTSWLLQVWQWATENDNEDIAGATAELISHAREPDYPLWEMARKFGVIGDTKRAERLYKTLGMPPMQPERTGWEKEINYSPVIILEETLWRRLYQALGWVNRTSDGNLRALNFFLWSPNGNPVRFVMQKTEEVSHDETEAGTDS